MSLVEFRNMKNKARKNSSSKAKQNLKLSFSKLAANRDQQALHGKPAIKTESQAINNNNRKGLIR